jgi:hypothetical protein
MVNGGDIQGITKAAVKVEQMLDGAYKEFCKALEGDYKKKLTEWCSKAQKIIEGRGARAD